MRKSLFIVASILVVTLTIAGCGSRPKWEVMTDQDKAQALIGYGQVTDNAMTFDANLYNASGKAAARGYKIQPFRITRAAGEWSGPDGNGWYTYDNGDGWLIQVRKFTTDTGIKFEYNAVLDTFLGDAIYQGEICFDNYNTPTDGYLSWKFVSSGTTILGFKFQFSGLAIVTVTDPELIANYLTVALEGSYDYFITAQDAGLNDFQYAHFSADLQDGTAPQQTLVLDGWYDDPIDGAGQHLTYHVTLT